MEFVTGTLSGRNVVLFLSGVSMVNAAMNLQLALDRFEVTGIVVPTVFRDFADFWEPFEGGTGAAPAYAATLPPEQRAEIRELLRSRLPQDSPIELTARAWAVRGVR